MLVCDVIAIQKIKQSDFWCDIFLVRVRFIDIKLVNISLTTPPFSARPISFISFVVEFLLSAWLFAYSQMAVTQNDGYLV